MVRRTKPKPLAATYLQPELQLQMLCESSQSFSRHAHPAGSIWENPNLQLHASVTSLRGISKLVGTDWSGIVCRTEETGDQCCQAGPNAVTPRSAGPLKISASLFGTYPSQRMTPVNPSLNPRDGDPGPHQPLVATRCLGEQRVCSREGPKVLS